MSLTSCFRNTLLKRICYVVAWVTYHLSTFYDRIRAAQAAFRNNSNGDLELNHRFAYPSIRLNRYWHTTRLLQLAPGTGREPLEGVLLTNVTIKILSWAWIFGERQYHAISYCWGDCSVTKMIYLDGKLLPITETLHCALQSLRRQETPVMLWADQICINQSQAAVCERNHQVQRMGEIYANAGSVIIWLGKSTEFSDRVFDRMITFNEVHLPQERDQGDDQATETGPQDEVDNIFPQLSDALRQTLNLNEDGPPPEELKLGFDDLLNNAWFSRIWVLQEAALAKKLFVQAGSQRLQWERFMACVRSLHTMMTGISAEHAQRVYDIEMLRRQKTSDEQEDDDLLMMVEAFRGRQATDLRDKIYALFGLTKWESPGRPFQADYSKSPEQVFTDFALWHIQTYGNVRVLAKCCSEEVHTSPTQRGRHPRLPLWATDWSLSSPSDCGDLVDDSFLPKTGTGLYHASRSLRADARIVFEQKTPPFLPSKPVLVLNGVIVDTVAQVVDEMHHWRHESDLTSRTWINWIRFALEERGPDPYGSLRHRLNALWRTLIIDRMNMLKRASPATGEDLEFLLTENVVEIGSGDRLPGARDDTARLTEELQNDCQQLRDKFAEWLQKWNSVHFGKKIFRTQRGYLGISCEHFQNGDKVAILWGGRLPFILREEGDLLLPGARGRPSLTDETVVLTYRLIGGECYVHGFADGEGLDIADREGLRPTKICLV